MDISQIARKAFAISSTVVLVCFFSAILQFSIHINYIRDELPLGWGGLLSPWAAGFEGFLFALPFVAIILYFYEWACLEVLRSWKFWALYFIPFSVALCLYISVTSNLDGGGTLLSRFLAQ